MDHNNRVTRIHAFPSTPSPSPSPPPSPPILSFISALTIATLLFICFYYLSAIVSFAFLLVLYTTTLLICRFLSRDQEASPNNNQRVVRVFNRVFLVVEEKRWNNHRQQQVKKLLLGSVVCFGSQRSTPSSSSSSRECSICLEDFKIGEECLVFCVCGHIFHCDCINHWLQEKPICPICRHYVPPSSATMIGNNSRTIEFLDNLV